MLIIDYLDVGQSGVAVGEVDPPRDAVKVGFGDDLYELLNASLRVDVLDVGLVLGERFNNLRSYR